MTKEEFLKQPFKLQHKIDCLKMKKEEFERLACAPTGPVYGDHPHSPNRNTEAPFIKWLDKIFECEKKIASLETELSKISTTVMSAIEKLDNQDYQNLLIMRYLNFDTWQTICEKLYISYSTCKRWHWNAVQSLELKDEP